MTIHIWLVVSAPLWKIWTSIGMMRFPIFLGKCQKWQPNHQPANLCYLLLASLIYCSRSSLCLSIIIYDNLLRIYHDDPWCMISIDILKFTPWYLISLEIPSYPHKIIWGWLYISINCLNGLKNHIFFCPHRATPATPPTRRTHARGEDLTADVFSPSLGVWSCFNRDVMGFHRI